MKQDTRSWDRLYWYPTDIQVSCGVDSWSVGTLIFVFRLKLGSISSAKKNLADEITWITWNHFQNLEIISYPNSYHDFQLRPKCRKSWSGYRRKAPTTEQKKFLFTLYEITPVAGLIFETKNRAIFLERFFWREITAREQVSRAVILEKF